jgi:hypothetical protein
MDGVPLEMKLLLSFKKLAQYQQLPRHPSMLSRYAVETFDAP